MSQRIFKQLGVRLRFSVTTLSLLGAFLFATQLAEATPNFMRKLKNPTDGCHACHTIMPRLNEFGYRFRAAGYRVPDSIGKGEEKPFEFGDYISAGITANYNLSKTETGTVFVAQQSVDILQHRHLSIHGEHRAELRLEGGN